MYYFISYMYGGDGVILMNGVIDIHPMDWQMAHNALYPGEYVLMNWQKISVLEYNKYKKVV